MKDKILIFVFDLCLLIELIVCLIACVVCLVNKEIENSLLICACIGGIMSLFMFLLTINQKVGIDLNRIRNHNHEMLLKQLMEKQIEEQLKGIDKYNE